MKTGFDTKEMETELSQVFAQYVSHSTRSVPEILRKQLSQLAVGAKGVRGLYQEARAIGPITKREIRALPERLSWRIKRQSGSVKAEIQRRLKHAGLYQASGWLEPSILEGVGNIASVKTLRAEIQWITGGSGKVSVRLINKTPNAAEFGARTGYILRALSKRIADMKVYVRRNANIDARKFSSKKPDFTGAPVLLAD